MEFDLVITNGNVVTHEGITETGIAINEGQIVAVTNDPLLPPAKKTIDATGKYVLPGIIDGHLHFGSYRPLDEDCRSETRACAAGGITTIGIHVEGRTPKNTRGILELFEERRRDFEANSLVDGFFHAKISDDRSLEEIHKCLDIGISTFQAKWRRETWGEKGGDPALFTILEQVGKLGPGARTIIHAENYDIAALLRERLVKEGRKDFLAWGDSRPNFCEEEFLMRSVLFAKVTNCPILIEHLTTSRGVDIAARAKQEGVDVIVETCPHYLTLNREYKGILRDDPSLGHPNPPFRDKENNERLWQAVRDGVVDCVGSDHCAPALKDKGHDVWDSPVSTGDSSEMILPVMLSEGVDKGRVSLEKVVEVCCYNPAKIYDLYPRKGIIAVGSDADIVMVDLGKKRKVSVAVLHSVAPWTLWESWEFRGWPVLTLLRGEVIMEEREVTGKTGGGRYLHRSKMVSE
jgi:dihydroorotase (multifunctional complex type)